MVAQLYIDQGYPIAKVLEKAELSRSSYYYKASWSDFKKGRPTSSYTKMVSGKFRNNEEVILDIKQILSEEFVDYGYYKVTRVLNDELGYIINHKKVYRLMNENQLLNKPKTKKHSNKKWVKNLLPQSDGVFSYWEIDIKYIYVQGQRRNAMSLTVIDVESRWVLGTITQWSITKYDVINLFKKIFDTYELPIKIYLRNDNGSQFEAGLVQEYLASKFIVQEFIRPATPQQNAHIESYHSIVESCVCQRFDFDTLIELQNTMSRFNHFYNIKRIHSGIGYISPYKYLLQKGTDLKVNLPPLEVLFCPIKIMS